MICEAQLINGVSDQEVRRCSQPLATTGLRRRSPKRQSLWRGSRFRTVTPRDRLSREHNDALRPKCAGCRDRLLGANGREQVRRAAHRLETKLTEGTMAETSQTWRGAHTAGLAHLKDRTMVEHEPRGCMSTRIEPCAWLIRRFSVPRGSV